jgi:NhaP-type Na+/H+ or K+/H+ antiporter
MESYIPIVAIAGFALLAMAWMPGLTRRIKISYSIIYVVLGVILYARLDFLPEADPVEYTSFSVRLTELMVIVSLMGTGLKIDEPFSFRNWRIPLRLISITMLLSIVLVALIGFLWLKLDIASAILLGAVLAPTDPVLADDVQVGPPLEKKRNDVRFSLTAEAGLNDGMAFPFTWLAITLAWIAADKADFWHWFGFDFIYRIVAGIIIGFLIGRIIAYLIFYRAAKKSFLATRDGFVAFSLTLLVYGVTELLQGYGFVAVFICAITLRNYELEHKYHIKLHSFTDQVERMLMAVVLILFGGTLVESVFTSFSWSHLAFALATVFIVRPATAWMSVIKSDLHLQERAAISFYGIKGIGSLFYLAFAISHADFQSPEKLWSITSTVILCSILVHGISAAVVMEKIEKRFPKERKPMAKEARGK